MLHAPTASDDASTDGPDPAPADAAPADAAPVDAARVDAARVDAAVPQVDAPASGVPAHARTSWWVPVLAVGIAVAGATGTYLGAGYVAHTLRNDHIVTVAGIEERVVDARGDLNAAITRAGAAGSAGSAFEEVVVDGLGSGELADELSTAAEDATRLAATDVPPLAAPIAYDESAARPAWISVIEVLDTRERGRGLLVDLESITADAARIDEAAATADDARVAFSESAAASAADLLEASAVATYESRIAVQHGIDQAGTGWSEAPDSAGAYRALAKAVDGVRASAKAETARRAEAAYAERGPIEAFARSIAHGVTLDFRWAHVVGGHSSDEWYSGTALYRSTDGGWATIELSHSIGWRYADDINAKAVVVHEVGHAQVVRAECRPLFTGPVFGGDDETWATAWAIASGYDVPGSGIEAYGRPTDAQIAEAAKCI